MSTQALGDVADFFSGNAWKARQFSDEARGVPLIRIQNVGADASKEFKYWPDEYDERYLIRNGDLLLTLSGSFRTALWEGPEALLNQRIVKVTPRNGFDRRWLFHALEDAMMRIAGMGRHALVSNVALSDLRQLKLAVPPLEEQRRIAGILDQADALRRLRTRALDKLNTLGQAIFHEMFVHCAEEEWPKVQVDDLIENARTGPFGSQLLHSEFVEEGIPVLGIDNVVQNRFVWAKERYISEDKYAELKRYTVLPGDVLITIMGTVGRCAIVPSDIPTAINTKHLCCLTLDRDQAIPEFLKACFLGHPDVLRQLGVQAKGAVMPGLNMGIIKALKLQLPPLALQKEFAEKLKALEKQAEKYESSTELSGTMFASLQHRAFRGEL